MIGINPVNFYNSIATSQVAPVYTTPVQPVHRIEGFSTTKPAIQPAAQGDASFENTLNVYLERYKEQTHVEFNTNTAYDQANQALESSILTGMNIDISV